MGKLQLVFALGLASLSPLGAAAQWPAPAAPVIPQADGYVTIPKVAIPPTAKRVYRAVYDATNALGVAGVPLRNAKFVVVFHGAALDGILDDAHYKAKYKIGNPNLKVLSEMRKAGVEIYVCGQNLAYEHIDPKTLSLDVTVASDALIVLMAYQNDGYALLSF